MLGLFPRCFFGHETRRKTWKWVGRAFFWGQNYEYDSLVGMILDIQGESCYEAPF